MKTKKIVSIAAATALGLGLTAASGSALAGSHAGMEKCYGVVKAGHNQCGTATHSCSGHAKKDGDTKEWIYVPKGTCKKLVNGSLKPK